MPWFKEVFISVISMLLGALLWHWILNAIRNRNPLSITIDHKFDYAGHGGTLGTLSYIDFHMKVNFKNNTVHETNIMIKDINLYPQKEIELFDFEYEDGVYPEIKSSPIKDFSVNPGSKLMYFKFKIKGNKKFDLSDIEENKDIPVIFEIKYALSPDFKEKTQPIKIEKFFDNLIKAVKNRNIF